MINGAFDNRHRVSIKVARPGLISEFRCRSGKAAANWATSIRQQEIPD